MEVEPLSDEVWTQRCVAQMIELDAKLEFQFAEPIAADLCTRSRWRAMTPEDAAQTLFDVGRKS